LISQGVPQLGGRQTTLRWQKQVFIYTRLLRAYLALAIGLLVSARRHMLNALYDIAVYLDLI